MEKLLSIENESLKITVSTKGAELRSIFCKKSSEELLWQADSKWWGKSAPILFPRINMEENNLTSITEITKHGFTRDHHFEVVALSENKIVLNQNENMIENFDFPFNFVCEFELAENTLKVNYKINAAFEFMIGSHPAFNINLKSNVIKNPGAKYFKLMDQKINFEESYNLESDSLELTKDTFSQDALIFANNYKDSSVVLNDKIALTHSAQYLGVWSKPDAPFVCLEPWYLETNSLRDFTYTITIL